MRRLGRALRSTDTAMLALLLAVSALLWSLRVQGPASVASDSFGNADQLNYFYPLHRLAAERLRHGQLPLWNPQQLAGLPLLATPQTAVFYLPNLLHLWLPSERVFELLAFAHLCWAAWLTYVLCRSLGVQPAAAVLGGASYAWSSYVVGCHLWPPCLAALAWFSLPLLGIALLERAPVWSALCLALGIAVLLVSGHFPLALYGLQGTAVYASFRLVGIGRRMGAAAAVSGACRLGLAALAGVLLAAPQWLPTWELVQLATRNPGGLTAQQLEPFGPVTGAALRSLFSPAVRGSGYAGVCSLLLLPLAALMPGRGQRRDALFFAGLALSFALLSLGSSTPLYAVYRQLPGTGLFRGPSRAMCMFALGASISGALCLQGLLARGEGGPERSNRQSAAGPVRWAALGVLGAGALVLLALLPRVSAWLVILSAVGIGAAVLVPRYLQPLALAALGCVLLVDLATIPSTPDRQVWRPAGLEPLAELAQPFRALARQLGSARCLVQPVRGHALAAAPRVAARYGLRVFEDYEPLSLQRYADYATFLQRGQLYDPQNTVLMYAGGLDRRAPFLHRRLLTAAGVRAIARARQRPDTDLGLEVEWLPDALPRAYVVHDVRPAQSATATLRGIARGELGGGAVALEGLPAAMLSVAPPASEPARAVLRHDEPERVVIEATLAAPAALVLLDAYYPGWRATVDGRRTRIYRANFLFRAVLLPAGKHLVVFEYESRVLALGFVLCAVGVVLLAALAVLLGRRPFAARPTRARSVAE